jgi:hypothetical protein
MNRDILEMINRVQRYGITLDDALALRRISMTLHRWYELECGDDYGCIERDDATGRPYWLNAMTGKRSRFPIADREKGALKRLDKIMSRYPELAAYVQTDPRGTALHIYRRDALRDGQTIDCCYASIGCAIYK